MGDDKVKADALEILGMFQVLPLLVVFDLDYTLWPFYWYAISLSLSDHNLFGCRENLFFSPFPRKQRKVSINCDNPDD